MCFAKILRTAEIMKGIRFNLEKNTLDIIDLYTFVESQKKVGEGLLADILELRKNQ
jgi:hypothetical protein